MDDFNYEEAVEYYRNHQISINLKRCMEAESTWIISSANQLWPMAATLLFWEEEWNY